MSHRIRVFAIHGHAFCDRSLQGWDFFEDCESGDLVQRFRDRLGYDVYWIGTHLGEFDLQGTGMALAEMGPGDTARLEADLAAKMERLPRDIREVFEREAACVRVMAASD